MNRGERDARKKKKREEKQRAARATSVVRTSDRIDSFLDPIAQSVASVLKSEGGGPKAHIEAVTRTATAMDAAISEVWRSSPVQPDCREGCSFCCRGVRVDVSPPEVARIVEYAREHLDAKTLARVEERARDNSSKTHGKTPLQYPLQLPCALLDEDGQCLVYEARPLACRQEHSLDVSQCEKGFENQESGVDTAVEHNIQVSGAAAMHTLGYRKALASAGLDSYPLELQEALHIALSKPEAWSEWLEHKPSFLAAKSNETIDKGAMLPGGLVQLSKRR